MSIVINLEDHSLANKQAMTEQKYGTYMNDGIREVDFVMVYKANEVKGDAVGSEVEERRKYFEENLEKEGLELETDSIVINGETMVFVKVHVPWKTMIKHAERLQIKAPLKIRDKAVARSKLNAKSKKSANNSVEVIPMKNNIKISTPETFQKKAEVKQQQPPTDNSDKHEENKQSKSAHAGLLFPVQKEDDKQHHDKHEKSIEPNNEVNSSVLFNWPHNSDSSDKKNIDHDNTAGLLPNAPLHHPSAVEDQQEKKHDDVAEHKNETGHGNEVDHSDKNTDKVPNTGSLPRWLHVNQDEKKNDANYNNADTAPILSRDQDKTDNKTTVLPEDGDVIINWPFRRKRLEMFDVKDQNTFFTEKQRIEIAYEILQKVCNDPKESKKRGIQVLLEQKVYESAYPLHDGDVTIGEVPSSTVKSTRQILKETWANWKTAFHTQPLTDIRNYFGEKIGFYYAFMDTYTKMLLFPSIVGLVTFIIGVISAATNPELADICTVEHSESEVHPSGGVHNVSNHLGSNHMEESYKLTTTAKSGETEADVNIASYWMCPICKPPGCEVWEMFIEGCVQYSWAFRLDNPMSFLLSSFTTLWAIIFLKVWKRREASLAAEWGTEDAEEQDIVIRPEYEERAPKQRKNPVTYVLEPYVPFGTGCLWLSASILATVLFLLFACLCLFVLVISRIALYSALKSFPRNVDLSRWLVHGFIFIVVMILEYAYSRIAHKLTEYECQRTEKKFMNSLLWKVFIFQLLNDLIPLSYAAWVKGRTVRTPLTMNMLDELCDGGCMGEVTELVAVLLLLRLVLGNMTEVAIPYFKASWKRSRAKKTADDNIVQPQYAIDFHLNDVELDGVYEDYMEMMIQFAFIVLFIPALPVAPFVCLMNNIAEIRVDATKMLLANRRPLPNRVSGIGIWNKFLNIINKLGIICNAALLAFTSDNIPRLYYMLHKHPGMGYKGVTKFTLSKIPVIAYGSEFMTPLMLEKNITDCYYPDFRKPDFPYEVQDFYWEIFFIRMVVFASYCIIFFTLTWIVNTFISDVPDGVKTKMRRRQYVVFKAMEVEAAMKQAKWTSENAPNGKTQ